MRFRATIARGLAALFLEHAVESLRCIDAGGNVIGCITREAVAARLTREDA